MGGFENYGADDLYNMEDVWNEKPFKKVIGYINWLCFIYSKQTTKLRHFICSDLVTIKKAVCLIYTIAGDRDGMVIMVIVTTMEAFAADIPDADPITIQISKRPLHLNGTLLR